MARAPQRSIGRPRTGKRSTPGYRQHSLLLPDEQFTQVQHELLDLGIDFSTLVEHLLDTWLQSGAKLPKD
jgi:hypothetical protein